MNAPMEVVTMNIYQRLNEVRKKVAYLRKTKEVSGAGTYKVVTHDQVTGELREYLIEFGIMVIPRLLRSVVANTGTTTGKGIPIIRYEAFYEIDFVNCEGGDKVTISIESHALDQGDKAPGKAISYATKYAMLKLFSIETGEDEEVRTEVKAEKPKATGVHKPAINEVGDSTKKMAQDINPERMEIIESIASQMLDWVNAGSYEDAIAIEENANLEIEERLFLNTFFDSKQRSEFKKILAARREKKD